MSDSLDKDPNILNDKWLTNWEEQCINEWETETNMEERIHNEKERSSQKLWTSFQNSASAISQLYKDGSHDNCVTLWVPFQNCASSVTTVYKESQEVAKKSFDLGNCCGNHRRTKDLLAWVKKRRRHIRREDLIAFLCGRNPPVRHRTPSTCTKSSSRMGLERSASRLPSPRIPTPSENLDMRDETDLQPFRDALALQGLNGAMSNVGITGQGQSARGSPSHRAEMNGTDDLHYFILDEMSRRCGPRKRSSSNEPVIDSPTRKRSRLL